MPARCFLAPEAWPRQTGEVVLARGREAHHLVKALRVRPGDTLLCFDGQGREMECSVEAVSSGSLTLRAGSVKRMPPPRWRVSLGVAVPGQGKLEEIVNSAVQLGVSEIIPLLTERTVVHLTPERFERKRDHLRQVAIEAAKQSETTRLPEIGPITPWSQLLPFLSSYDKVFLGAVEGPHEDWRGLLTPLPTSPVSLRILLLIGPEGDFSPGEIRQAVSAGAHRISLGESVLRCETAAVSALSILFFLLREG